MDKAHERARKSAYSAALNELARAHPAEFAELYRRYRVACGIEPDHVQAAWRTLLDLIAGECRQAGMLPP